MLTTIRWGLENGTGIQPLSPEDKDTNRLMAQITAMTRWEPGNVMAFLLDPERIRDGGVALQAAPRPGRRRRGSGVRLESLYNAMVANDP